MKKFILSSVVIGGFVFYSLHERLGLFEDDDAKLINAVSMATVSPSSTPIPPTPSAQPGIVTSTATPVPTAKGQYKDGTYTGVSADAYYGNVQVKVTVSAGKIVDVVFLDYPQDRRTSQMINQQAMPMLKQEAISAQTAIVNTISGASQTSRGFRASLASALVQAKN